MIPIFVDGPAVEPVTLSDMKAYLRADDDPAQDDLIAGLVKAARLMVEASSRRILIAQRWRVVLDRWPPGGTIMLPLSPVMSIDALRVANADGTATEVPPEAYESDLLGDPPRVVVSGAPEPGRPRHGISIELRAGYGTSPEAVPATLKLAIRILVAHWFEHRGDVVGEQILPPEALALVAPFQRARL